MPVEPLHLPTGVITQRPPIYSAIKIDGKRAYARARAGEVVEIPEREVEVTRFEQLSNTGEYASFAIECSSGTYVRTLISDLHDAYCVQLRRTHIGGFDVANADEERLIGLDDALSFLPVLDIEGDAADKAAHGVAVPGHAKTIVRLRDAEGLIALAEPRGGATLKPVVGFRG
jgi:tRNA pseudouridine55 synthase